LWYKLYIIKCIFYNTRFACKLYIIILWPTFRRTSKCSHVIRDIVAFYKTFRRALSTISDVALTLVNYCNQITLNNFSMSDLFHCNFNNLSASALLICRRNLSWQFVKLLFFRHCQENFADLRSLYVGYMSVEIVGI
jgi:hypothetical protein